MARRERGCCVLLAMYSEQIDRRDNKMRGKDGQKEIVIRPKRRHVIRIIKNPTQPGRAYSRGGPYLEVKAKRKLQQPRHPHLSIFPFYFPPACTVNPFATAPPPTATVNKLGAPSCTAPLWSTPPVGVTSSKGNAYPLPSAFAACTIRA